MIANNMKIKTYLNTASAKNSSPSLILLVIFFCHSSSDALLTRRLRRLDWWWILVSILGYWVLGGIVIWLIVTVTSRTLKAVIANVALTTSIAFVSAKWQRVLSTRCTLRG